MRVELSGAAPAAYLLHGPGAEAEAAAIAAACVPVLELRCEGGLRVDGAREVSEALSVVTPGGRAGVVTVGPLDGSTPKALDALLKGAEELRGTASLLAWAADDQAVSQTLRSRCLRVYCAGVGGADESARTTARAVVEALQAGESWRVVELVKGVDGRDLAAAVAEVGAAGDPLALGLWMRLRAVAVQDRPCGRPRVLQALLGGR